MAIKALLGPFTVIIVRFAHTNAPLLNIIHRSIVICEMNSVALFLFSCGLGDLSGLFLCPKRADGIKLDTENPTGLKREVTDNE